MSKVNILGVMVDDIEAETLEREIVACVDNGTKKIFAYANVHAINIAQQDRKFMSFLNNADVLYCDGMGIRVGARILGVKPPSRTALTHWIWNLSALLQERQVSVYILGGNNEDVVAAVVRLCKRLPGLRVVGFHDGFFVKEGPENDAVVGLINEAKPGVLLVGFGMPEQEMWIEDNVQQLKVNALIPCGGLIDYLAGRQSVAPGWMSEWGMEWLHRLLQDPWRLWRRYLLGNPMFLVRIMLQRLTGGLK
jgi:N-acetylglucosaminyldiphosphoundecaprenol N-acetyl-beta-D-mannosaminyltransferase